MAEVTNLSIFELCNRLNSGSISSQDVLMAFTLKAIEATEATNCVTEFLFEEAMARAQYLDNLPPENRGPLFGIPFSVNEHFHIKDKDSTVGLFSRLDQPAKENADLGKMSCNAAGFFIGLR